MPDRFPPPWSVKDNGDGAWEVRDANQFPLTWFHYETRRSIGTNTPRMTREQAYAMAVNFARLPELLGKK